MKTLMPLFAGTEQRRDHQDEGLVVDLFAGGGGASLGLAWALGRGPDIGINHDEDALRNHALNHPETRHIPDDIRAVDPVEVTEGRPVDLLWASPDCRHFSPAKGGKPCHPKVRSLPWEVTKWARAVKPAVICMENVPAMQTWGPLHDTHSAGCKSKAVLECDHGSYEEYARCRQCKSVMAERPAACTTKRCRFSKPVAKAARSTWNAWIKAFEDEGYVVRSWVLYAHHYGAKTSRKRLFIVCRRDGVEPVCPPRTHGPGLLPEGTAADCIDWNDLGESIFDENGQLHHADATLRRIATGVMRYVVNAKKPFIVTCNHSGEGFRGQGLDEPFKTVAASHDAHGLVTPELAPLGPFVAGVGGRKPVDEPLNTTTSKNDRAIVTPVVAPFMVHRSNGERPGQTPRTYDVQAPHPTAVAGGQKTALVAAFLAKHYGHGPGRTGGWPGGQELDRPIGTVTTQDHHSVVAATLTKFYGTNESGAPIDKPLGAVTSGAGGGHHGLVAASLIRTDNTSDGRLRGLTDLRQPLKTITTSKGAALVAAFLSTYYGNGDNNHAADEPMATQTTRHRHALVTVELDGVTYVIVDIRMRMVKADELKLAQGFPYSYRIEGSEKLKVRLIGNSVPPQMAEAIVRSNRPRSRVRAA